MARPGKAQGRRIRRIRQTVNQHRAMLNGPKNEERLIRIISDYLEHGTDRPPWLLGVRAADAQEQRQGIDAVVMSTDGPLFIQVKSSDVFLRKFERRQQHRFENGRRVFIIGLIIIQARHSDGQVLGNALKILRSTREQVRRYGLRRPICRPA